MKYSADITDHRMGFDTILSAAQNFNCDRFVYAIRYKNIKEDALIKLRDYVAFHRKLVEKEHDKLQAFSLDYNKKFVVSDNMRFDTALILLKQLRCSISGTKRLVMRFCPRTRRDALARWFGNKLVSAFDYSYITSDIYQLDLFKFEGYPDCVSEVYNEMEKFFALLVRSIQLCKQVLLDEDEVRKDQGYCYALFEDFKEEVLEEIDDYMSFFTAEHPDLQEENNAVIACRNNYDSDLAWAPVGFHNGTRRQVKHLIIKQLLEQQVGNDLTTTEILLFGNDPERVHKIRHVIMNFEVLFPENYHRDHLPAKHIQMFMQYYGIKKGLGKNATKYFYEIYRRNPSNTLNMVSYGAVYSTIYVKEVKEDIDGCFTEFSRNLKSHFYNTIPLQKFG